MPEVGATPILEKQIAMHGSGAMTLKTTHTNHGTPLIFYDTIEAGIIIRAVRDTARDPSGMPGTA